MTSSKDDCIINNVMTKETSSLLSKRESNLILKKEQRKNTVYERKRSEAASTIQRQLRGHFTRLNLKEHDEDEHDEDEINDEHDEEEDDEDEHEDEHDELLQRLSTTSTILSKTPFGILCLQVFGGKHFKHLLSNTKSLFVKIQFKDEIEITRKIKNTINPIWNVEAVFDLSVNVVEMREETILCSLCGVIESNDTEKEYVIGNQWILVHDIIKNDMKTISKKEIKDENENVVGILKTTAVYEEGTDGYHCQEEVDENHDHLKHSSDDIDAVDKRSSDSIDKEIKKEYVWPTVLNEEPSDGWPDITTDSTDTLSCNGQLRLFITTWNLQAHKPPNDLSSFLKPGSFHLYAIGTEECVNSIAKSVVFTSKKEWENKLCETLGLEYTIVASHGLQAIHNIVFVHTSLLPLISNVHSSAIATGLGNTLGNKGGIGITLSVNKTTFLFVSCHFEAHQNRVAKRNDNYSKINRELKLFKTSRGKDASASCDRVFWSGDFNYRINGTRKMVDSLLYNNMHDVLYANDQLHLQKSQGHVFPHFKEGPLHFKPTYKYDRGTCIYDTSHKKRIPAWTDRILYKSKKESTVKLRTYASFDTITTSDHRPVYAIFDVEFESSREKHHGSPPTQHTRSEVCLIS